MPAVLHSTPLTHTPQATAAADVVAELAMLLTGAVPVCLCTCVCVVLSRLCFLQAGS